MNAETKPYNGNIICAMTGRVLNNTSEIGDIGSILLDSGASNHIFIGKRNFKKYQECIRIVEIGENGRSVEIVGKGDATLSSTQSNFVFCNELHVPSRMYCLLSKANLLKGAAHIVNQKKGFFDVVEDGKTVITCEVKNKLTFLKLGQKRIKCKISLE